MEASVKETSLLVDGLCLVDPRVMDFSDIQPREAHRDAAKGQSIPRGTDREAESVGAR